MVLSPSAQVTSEFSCAARESIFPQISQDELGQLPFPIPSRPCGSTGGPGRSNSPLGHLVTFYVKVILEEVLVTGKRNSLRSLARAFPA